MSNEASPQVELNEIRLQLNLIRSLVASRGHMHTFQTPAEYQASLIAYIEEVTSE